MHAPSLKFDDDVDALLANMSGESPNILEHSTDKVAVSAPAEPQNANTDRDSDSSSGDDSSDTSNDTDFSAETGAIWNEHARPPRAARQARRAAAVRRFRGGEPQSLDPWLEHSRQQAARSLMDQLVAGAQVTAVDVARRIVIMPAPSASSSVPRLLIDLNALLARCQTDPLRRVV